MLLGDYANINQLKKIDDDQREELDSLLAREKVLLKTVTNVGEGWESYREPYEDEEKEADYQTKKKELVAVKKKKRKFYQSIEQTSHVWLFIRK